ncbi:MAG TPA: response regulator [Smithellaceae bacterium]|nr:response regulator [Smithellaceae bacterium]HPL48951.1 response regulator [Smithella sp.]
MKPKILIVDDGESQRFVLKGFLLREGYLVDEAENGIKALQCIRDQHFDIILLDHKMPGMNGVEVLKEVKRTNPEIAVVIISAYGTIERAVEAMEAGAFYYITKPVELDKLLIILDHISQRHLLVNSQRRALHQRLGDMNEGIDAMNDQKEDNKTFLYSMLSRIFSAQSDGFIVGMNDRTIC